MIRDVSTILPLTDGLVIKPEGYFALTCFVEGGDLGGATLSDIDVYRERSLQGGLGFTEFKYLTLNLFLA